MVDRITHTFELQALSEQETIKYINNRITNAGGGDEELFSPKVLKKIYKMSAGVPARINELAHIALDNDESAEPDVATEEAYADDADYQLEKPRSIWRMTLYISLGLILALALWQQDRINQLFNDADYNEIFSSKPDIEEYLPKKQPPLEQESPFAKPENKEQIIELTPNQSTVPVVPGKAVDKTPAPVKTQQASPVKAEKSAPPSIIKVEPNPLIAGNTETEIVLHGKNFTPQAKITLSWTGNSKELPSAQINVESESLIRLRLNPGRKADKWTVTVSDPARGISNTQFFNTIARTKPKPAQASTEAMSPHEWVMAQPAKHFSLQLLGSHSLQPINTYIKQNKLQDNSKIIKTRHKGKDWYILLSGSYDSKDQARQAIDQLSGQAKRNKPWLRSFASIQQQLKQEANTKPKPVTESKQPTLDNLKAHEAWIWSQDPGHYTLQLLGTHSISSLQQFIKRHQLRGKVVYYHTQRDGKDWFALVYGNYANNQQARKAAAELPDTLKKQNPWLRNFSTIHAEMDKSTRR